MSSRLVSVLLLCAIALSAQAQQASTAVPGSADSLYRVVRARLDARGYRFEQVDSVRRRLVVRAPDLDPRVEVQILPQGDSAVINVTTLGGDALQGMQALITATHDATIGESDKENGLAASQWRPELFISREGRFWIAQGGLYTADSLRGSWRRVFGNKGQPVDPDELRIGVSMGLVDEGTAVLGLPALTEGPKLYRTTDGGKTWSPVPVADLAWVDDIAAASASVWVFGTRWENHQRRGLFLRSSDGAATWERAPLPAALNDVTHLYRVSPSTAYVATMRSDRQPVFWRTTDGGATWQSIHTPHDKGLHKVPSYGVRVEEIATAGDWLVVREYGVVFVSRADLIQWRRLEGIEHVAADVERDQLFVLTDSLHAEMLDRNLNVVWRTKDRIPDRGPGEPTNVEKALARGGIGYVSMSQGEVYEARDGTLRRVQPRAEPR